jgi:hypothetical protein
MCIIHVIGPVMYQLMANYTFVHNKYSETTKLLNLLNLQWILHSIHASRRLSKMVVGACPFVLD